jgi:hypothetical protein
MRAHFVAVVATFFIVLLGPSTDATAPAEPLCSPTVAGAAINPGAPANDECDTALELPLTPWNTTFSITIDTTEATPSNGTPCDLQLDRTVWFTLPSASYPAVLYVTTTGTDYPHSIPSYPVKSDACSERAEPGGCERVPDPSRNIKEHPLLVHPDRRFVFMVGAPVGSAGGTLRLSVRYAPHIPRLMIGFGDGAENGGWSTFRGYAPAFNNFGEPFQIDWPDFANGGGGIHPAAGDTDTDGYRDRVYGLGRGGQGFLLADDIRDYLSGKWLQVPWPAYNAANGETFPAVGNIDLDAADEVVVGLGRGGGGFFFVFDDALTNYEPIGWGRVPWSAYVNGDDGSIRPAIGDVNGDGVEEIILGLGRGGSGYLAILNGLQQKLSLRTWIRVEWPSYNDANGETFPAAGDLDGDGTDEIAIGLGGGGGGFVAVRDDESSAFQLVQWLNVGWSAYNAANGETHPAIGNADGDDRAELVVGLGDYPSGGTWLRAFDDSDAGLTPFGWVSANYASAPALAGRATFPVIGDF